MAWGFERGRVYNRRADIHDRFGGQRQGGIITPADHPLVIIITGEEGLAHGYADRYRADGVFEYFGEGQVGDMAMVRGNAAIANHSVNGRSLLLFRKLKQGLRFEDEMVYEAHHTEQAPDRKGAIRNAIVFELRPLESVDEVVDASLPDMGVDLATLRRRAYEAANPSPDRRGAAISVFDRSRHVRDYVLARANGHCEGCTRPAPFNRADGSPYLDVEPHHIRRLSDGGPDDPRYIIALCPNCHRQVHFGADGAELNCKFVDRMAVIESAS
jgi:5-methylcytosine-specific restriction protein A